MNAVDASEQAYLQQLAHNPEDVAALDGLGMLAARTGRLDAALSALSRAAQLAPHDAQIQIHLAHIYHDRCEWEAARLQYARALYLAPDDPLAHEGAAYTAMRLNDLEQAEKHRSRAFQHRALTQRTVSLAAPTMLLILSAYGGNVDMRPYLAAEAINVVKLIAEELDQVTVLPEFDYVFHGIGDPDHHSDTLRALHTLTPIIEQYHKPILNHPAAVLRSRRDENAYRFARLPHVRTPRVVRLQRSESAEESAWLLTRAMAFPFLLRVPGFHTGEHFCLVSTQEELVQAMHELPGDELLALEYLDTRDEHGLFRKYRMMSIGGVLYPAHLAIDAQWKVHYRHALTTSSEAFLAEEARYLEDPERVLGEQAMSALHAISTTLNLDYAGIDFSVDAAGRVVCFEANAMMVVPLPSHTPANHARRAAAQAIHHAMKRLLWL